MNNIIFGLLCALSLCLIAVIVGVGMYALIDYEELREELRISNSCISVMKENKTAINTRR
jgi:hypothetical protein